MEMGFAMVNLAWLLPKDHDKRIWEVQGHCFQLVLRHLT
jgi:hypothetical protein